MNDNTAAYPICIEGEVSCVSETQPRHTSMSENSNPDIRICQNIAFLWVCMSIHNIPGEPELTPSGQEIHSLRTC